jgi:hypothetical protein
MGLDEPSQIGFISRFPPSNSLRVSIEAGFDDSGGISDCEDPRRRTKTERGNHLE